MTTKRRPKVEITLRIPGAWSSPEEINERLPTGYQIIGDRFVLPHKTEVEIFTIPADQQFPNIFRSSLRRAATSAELKTIRRYTLTVGLIGPGGSLESARIMLQAGAAIIRAGGAGVFIDNSCLAHGGRGWLEMAENGSSDAISFAFVALAGGGREIYTLGMQVTGLPDIILNRADAAAADQSIIDIIRKLCARERPVAHGQTIADERGGRFRVRHEFPEPSGVPEPMRNPLGRMRLLSHKARVERN